MQKNLILVSEQLEDKAEKQTAQIRLQILRGHYKAFSKAAGLPLQEERAWVAGFGRSEAAKASAAANEHHKKWLKSIGAENSELNTVAKYADAKYNNSPDYQLLNGYRNAVDKGDISPLIGIDVYKQYAKSIQNEIIGKKTVIGIEIASFTTHFIDRTIGQVSTPHRGKRCGTPVEDSLDALQAPISIGKTRTLPDGDVRQTFKGTHASVTISIRDKRLIQTNPRKGE